MRQWTKKQTKLQVSEWKTMKINCPQYTSCKEKRLPKRRSNFAERTRSEYVFPGKKFPIENFKASFDYCRSSKISAMN
jgi:hypothetical protein